MATCLCTSSRTLSRHTLSRHIMLMAFTATTATVSASLSYSSSSSSSSSHASSIPPVMKLLQVQVVHRHGDRTPITPLLNEDFWRQKLIPKSTLDKISSNTVVLRDPNMKHGAKGRPPFGQLTQLGLLQMIQVGSTLRERYFSPDSSTDASSTSHPSLHPSNIRVYSTDFDRTIQSVQGLLVGLFPDPPLPESTEQGGDDNKNNNSNKILIDARHTQIMIPDPLPRQLHEQVLLEQTLAKDPLVRMREQEMMPLAMKASYVLKPLLAPDAHEVSFGVDQEHPGDQEIEIEPLAWNQLAEISKCLSVYNQLPLDKITALDLDTILEYTAHRWFHNLRHTRLNYLAMNTLVMKQLESFLQQEQRDLSPSLPPAPVTIWSAHDSTLIGLLCAYRLEQPTRWPEYASYLILELLQEQEHHHHPRNPLAPNSQIVNNYDPDKDSSSHNNNNNNNNSGELFVRFSLNGEYLRSKWDEDKEPRDMIPLSMLVERMQRIAGDTEPQQQQPPQSTATASL